MTDNSYVQNLASFGPLSGGEKFDDSEASRSVCLRKIKSNTWSASNYNLLASENSFFGRASNVQT